MPLAFTQEDFLVYTDNLDEDWFGWCLCFCFVFIVVRAERLNKDVETLSGRIGRRV